MEVSNNDRYRLATDLQNLPAEQIKKAVIELLNTENTESIDWEHSLSMEIITFREWVNNQRRTKSPLLYEEVVSTSSTISN